MMTSIFDSPSDFYSLHFHKGFQCFFETFQNVFFSMGRFFRPRTADGPSQMASHNGDASPSLEGAPNMLGARQTEAEAKGILNA
jgi:hypothetical protein